MQFCLTMYYWQNGDCQNLSKRLSACIHCLIEISSCQPDDQTIELGFIDTVMTDRPKWYQSHFCNVKDQ